MYVGRRGIQNNPRISEISKGFMIKSLADLIDTKTGSETYQNRSNTYTCVCKQNTCTPSQELRNGNCF